MGLANIPVELIYQVQLFAFSPNLPHTSKHLYQVFKSAPASFYAEYILHRSIAAERERAHPGRAVILTRALRYPLCSTEVLDALYRHLLLLSESPGSSSSSSNSSAPPELARRLFRTLVPPRREWNESDPPLPFLRHLYASTSWCRGGVPAAAVVPEFFFFPDPNSYQGYALTRAVYARFRPLVRFLLDHGACPGRKNALAVMMAIRWKDLSLVRMLIERSDDDDDDGGGGGGGGSCSAGVGEREKKKKKRLRLQDRVEVTSEMLKEAVRCDAREIVEYLLKEKGCVPDMQTIRLLRSIFPGIMPVRNLIS